jgi:hypothetical protein
MNAGDATPLPKQSGPEASAEFGPWAAKLHIPGSVEMPDKNPVIKCELPEQRVAGMLSVTITNLMSRSYVVRYFIYGYDTKNRRVSESDEDVFTIGSHETVVRRIFVLPGVTEKDLRINYGQTFWVQIKLEK